MSTSTIDWNSIKRSITIGEVLRRYGYHVPARESYRIPCMLHGGTGLNFSVTERDNVFHCFTCGASGSVIDLVAALEKIEPKEAAHKISNDFSLSQVRASVAIARTTMSLVERYKKMKNDSITISLPPHTQLEDDYRGLTRKTINFWNLVRGTDGVIIPLVNSKGEFCSYSVRRNDGNPKYENAAGVSKCYPFGLHQNKQAIIDEGSVYLVEGQLDAVAMWQHDYHNVIAIMGSQVSEQQAMLILTVTSHLVLVMDGDEAGRKAASEINKKWGSIFKVITLNLPDGIDPDEYLFKGGRLGDLAT